MLSHPTHTLTEMTHEAWDSVNDMGLVVQEKKEGGDLDGFLKRKGEEAGVTVVQEKKSVHHSLERD